MKALTERAGEPNVSGDADASGSYSVRPRPLTRDICDWCGRIRPMSELLAYWEPGNQAETRYVCRPLVEGEDVRQGQCFRLQVGARSRWTIALPATT